MKHKEILDQAKSALVEIYNQYSKEGLVAIYLHGSILTTDFNDSKSDVDPIAITKANHHIGIDKKINDGLEVRYPHINHFTVRFLYQSELNGQEIKGFITRYIAPALLLFDLPNWELVAGTAIHKEEFGLGNVNINDLIKIRLKQIEWKMETLNEEPDNYIYLLKAIARLCHLIQSPMEKFSYSNLIKNSTPQTKTMVDLLLKIRAENWNKKLFKESGGAIKEFVTYISKNLN